MKPIKPARIFLISALMISACAFTPLNQPKYKIVHEALGLHDNSGICYYILVPKIDDLMKDQNYKANIKRATKKIVSEKGEKVLLYFFDDKELLEKYYQAKLITSTYHESKEELVHHIADYYGKSSVGNWLVFFPGISPANYVHDVEMQYQLMAFEPSQYKGEE